MPTENVRVITGAVNPSIEEAINWIQAKVSCGDIAESTGRLAVTSIRALSAMLTVEEPQDDVIHFCDNLETLVMRWMRKNQDAKGDTAKAYAGRAKGALELFLSWRENPSTFRFPELRTRRSKDEIANGTPKPERRSAGRRSVAAPPPPAAAPMPAAAAPAPAPVSTYANRFKLGADKVVLFELPENGFTVADWKRLVAHMLTLCDDFDPEHAPQVPGFGMVRNQ